MTFSIKSATACAWSEVCKKVRGAVVFVDEPTSESLSWHGGLRLLLASGATDVRDFSSFESGDEASKGVFLVSSPLAGPTRIVLRDLLTNSRFQHCVLIMSCSPTVVRLASDAPDETTALRGLEADMLRWMKGDDLAVEIVHLLISCIPVSDNLFTLPQFARIPTCFVEDLVGKGSQQVDIESLPLELQVGLVHLMTTLNSLLSQLSARESIFCLGPLSSVVGSQLAKHPASAQRLKSAEQEVSLVIVDRALDLCSPLLSSSTSPTENSLMDRLKATLPPLPGHSVDVAIDMSRLCYAPPPTREASFSPVAPGCLHDPPSDWITDLINRPTTDIVPALYKQLATALHIDHLPTKITLNHLSNLVETHFIRNYESLKNNLSPVQAAVAVLNCFQAESSQSHDVVISLQKMLLQSVSAEGGTNEAMQHLIRVVLERRDRQLSIDSILALLVFFYSLIGRTFPIDLMLERSLQDVVVEMLTEEAAKPKPTSQLLSKAADPTQLTDRIFLRLRALSGSRDGCRKYADLVRLSAAGPLEIDGVLRQLFYDLVDVTRPDVPDLKYKASLGLRNNIASRFSMMLNSSTAHVMDKDTVIVFVVGGVSARELKDISNIFRLYGKRLIVGSTSLLSPAQIIENLFLHDPLRPFAL